jgi:hypothetical protein
LTIDDARKFVQGLANYNALDAVHREQFDKALDCLEQALALDFVERVDTALNENQGSCLEDPVAQVCDVLIEIRVEHGLASVPQEGKE